MGQPLPPTLASHRPSKPIHFDNRLPPTAIRKEAIGGVFHGNEHSRNRMIRRHREECSTAGRGGIVINVAIIGVVGVGVEVWLATAPTAQ